MTHNQKIDITDFCDSYNAIVKSYAIEYLSKIASLDNMKTLLFNDFSTKSIKELIDFAHNPSGYRGIEDYLESVTATKKIGIIAGVGDRRDEDIILLGTLAAKMFDEIIIRQDRNLRGRSEQEIIDLMLKGIYSVDPKKKYIVIPSEPEAIEYAFKNARKGSFITICSDVVPDALGQVMRYKEEEDRFTMSSADIPNQPEIVK